MYVSRLALTDFRSYDSLDLPLPAGVCALLGANGEGKTNVVEAVGYLAVHGSHRAATDAPLVRHGTPFAVVRADVVDGGRTTTVEVQINPGASNRARVNRAVLPRAREALGLLREVTFAPEDLALVRGDPAGRRRFLDDVLVEQAPRLAGVRQDYERVLRQRTKLLRSAAAARVPRSALTTLDAWDVQLARAGAELLAARLELVARLRPVVGRCYATLAGGVKEADLQYRTSVCLPAGAEPRRPDELVEPVLAALAARRSDELERGLCLVGPHRDDLDLTVAGLPARGYASHGEAWSLALALRLASYELFAAQGSPPVLVLDDVFAELDGDRRARIVELTKAAEQTFVTAAVPADLPAGLAATRFDVAGGRVCRAR